MEDNWEGKLQEMLIELDKDPLSNLHERALHALLTYFVFTNLDVHSKTIYHEKSPGRKKRKGFNKWIHPDLVGVHFPVQKWERNTLELSKVIGEVPLVFYSFEVKKKLSFSNFREAFFQTVSNSSWAHEAYLVAAKIEAMEELIVELNRLCSSFSVGVILLDPKDFDSSKVLIPASRKPQLDFEAMNKLASENPDFLKFLETVSKAIKVNEINQDWFDPVLDQIELRRSLTEALKKRKSRSQKKKRGR